MKETQNVQNVQENVTYFDRVQKIVYETYELIKQSEKLIKESTA